MNLSVAQSAAPCRRSSNACRKSNDQGSLFLWMKLIYVLSFLVLSQSSFCFFFFVLRNRGCSMKLFLTATFNARVRVAISVCLFNRMNK